MWEALAAIAVGLIGLGGVVLGQHMSRSVAQSTQFLQLEEQRRLEVRRLLVQLIIDARAKIDEAWLLLPMMQKFESKDWHEWITTDTGRDGAERNKRMQATIVTLGLSVPDGDLREALRGLEVEAIRDWPEKAVGPVTDRKPPADGRDRLEVAYGHVRVCQKVLTEVQCEAGLCLAVPPEMPPTMLERWKARRKK